MASRGQSAVRAGEVSRWSRLTTEAKLEQSRPALASAVEERLCAVFAEPPSAALRIVAGAALPIRAARLRDRGWRVGCQLDGSLRAFSRGTSRVGPVALPEWQLV